MHAQRGDPIHGFCSGVVFHSSSDISGETLLALVSVESIA